MNFYVYNDELGRYEPFPGFLAGKSPPQIANEYGISDIRARQYALVNKLPYFGEEDKIYVYVYDAASEEKFVNRPKESSGRPRVEKPPKVPGKRGRPRKEKPVPPPKKKQKKAIETGVPKRGRGRPRKIQ
jgi:hypothetical protein